MPAPARLLDLGLRPYREVWDLQRSLHARVAAGAEPDVWIAVEHPPVVTLGRNAKREHLLLSPEMLAARGVDCFEVERGGDVTYHGPGQVVVYPILRLPRFREVVPLVARSRTPRSPPAPPSAWSPSAGASTAASTSAAIRYCAIGLAVKQMTSMHGIALNACTALDYDRLITPCGISERGITSLSHECGRHVSFDEAKVALLAALAARFDVAFVPAAAAGLVSLGAAS